MIKELLLYTNFYIDMGLTNVIDVDLDKVHYWMRFFKDTQIEIKRDFKYTPKSVRFKGYCYTFFKLDQSKEYSGSTIHKTYEQCMENAILDFLKLITNDSKSKNS